MFEGAIHLRFTFGVCRFYIGLNRMIRLKKIRGGVYCIIVITLYYIPPPTLFPTLFLAQIESDPCGLTVL